MVFSRTVVLGLGVGPMGSGAGYLCPITNSCVVSGWFGCSGYRRNWDNCPVYWTDDASWSCQFHGRGWHLWIHYIFFSLPCGRTVGFYCFYHEAIRNYVFMVGLDLNKLPGLVIYLTDIKVSAMSDETAAGTPIRSIVVWMFTFLNWVSREMKLVYVLEGKEFTFAFGCRQCVEWAALSSIIFYILFCQWSSSSYTFFR